MYIIGQWALQEGFSRALQLAFKNHSQFGWDPDTSKSKIHIYGAYPLDQLRRPSIIVRVTGGPALLRGIGDEISDVDTTEITQDGASYNRQTAYTYSGNMKPSVSLMFSARTGAERAMVIDWAMLSLRHFATDKFQREGILIEDMQMGPQTERVVGSDVVYDGSLSIRCMTGFSRKVSIAERATLNAVCLTNVFTVVPGGISTN